MVLDIHARNGGVTHCWWLALLGLVWSKFSMDVIVFASFGCLCVQQVLVVSDRIFPARWSLPLFHELVFALSLRGSVMVLCCWSIKG